MRLYALFKKEYIQFFRNSAMVGLLFFAFFIDVWMSGSGGSDLKDYAVAVYNRDGTEISQSLIDKIGPPYFKLDRMVYSDEEVDKVLTDGIISVVLIIPKDFSKQVGDGKTAKVQLVIDGTRSNDATTAMGYLQTIIQMYANEITVDTVTAGGEKIPSVEIQTQNWYNPNLEGSYRSGFSELLIMLTLLSVMLPAATMVQEKEIGTIEQLSVTPVSNYEIMLAKIIPMTTIILVCTFLSLYFVVMGVLNTPIVGSIPFFLLVTVIHVFSSAGIGLTISTIARSMAETIMFSLIVVTPLLFLSGNITPVIAMNPVVQYLAYLFPLRWYIEIALAIVFKGAGPGELVKQISILLFLGLILFFYSASRFRDSLEKAK